jgi:hypothetical protein
MTYYLENLWHVLESCLCSHFVVATVQLRGGRGRVGFGKRRVDINMLCRLAWLSTSSTLTVRLSS